MTLLSCYLHVPAPHITRLATPTPFQFFPTQVLYLLPLNVNSEVIGCLSVQATARTDAPPHTPFQFFFSTQALDLLPLMVNFEVVGCLNVQATARTDSARHCLLTFHSQEQNTEDSLHLFFSALTH